ncbi:MAG: hypothetical protein ACREFB_09910 [Stellaceae bacterium]
MLSKSVGAGILWRMTRPRAADDFGAIRQRIKELRGERREPDFSGRAEEVEARAPGRGLGTIDERYRARAEGAPPPWIPTIFE